MIARVPTVLSVAGSDPGGGAGIQADLKAFARCGVHGMTAIAAVTVQNTVEVRGFMPVPPETVLAQIRVVAEDLGVDAVKVGMLGNDATIAAVAEGLAELPQGTPIVVDPVMVAESGGRLLETAAEDAMRTRILPLATVITPNVGEARVLARAADDVPLEEVARVLREELGARNVIITGGHRDVATDLLFAEDGTVVEIPGQRYPDGAAHGSGCTHSSALAAHLALGYDLPTAARAARKVAGEAVRDGLRHLGRGAGPVDVLGLARRAERGEAGALGDGDDAAATRARDDAAATRVSAGDDAAATRVDAAATGADTGGDAAATGADAGGGGGAAAPARPGTSLPLS